MRRRHRHWRVAIIRAVDLQPGDIYRAHPATTWKVSGDYWQDERSWARVEKRTVKGTQVFIDTTLFTPWGSTRFVNDWLLKEYELVEVQERCRWW